jgi:hypothetical protein
MTLFPPSSFDDRLETTVRVLYTQSKWTCSKNKVVSARHVLYCQRPQSIRDERLEPRVNVLYSEAKTYMQQEQGRLCKACAL